MCVTRSSKRSNWVCLMDEKKNINASAARGGRGRGHLQSGVALVVVMVLLIAISGIGVWTVRRSLMGENTARNQIDQQAARQAAESALRDAERDIMNVIATLQPGASCARGLTTGLNPNEFTSTCNKGLCVKSELDYNTVNWSTATAGDATLAEPWWPKGKGGSWNEDVSSKPDRTAATVDTGHCEFTGGVPLGTYSGAEPIRGVARQPEYLIEVFKRKNVRINIPEPQVVSGGEFANQWSTMYRITARGFGYSSKTQVVLQTIYFP